MQLQEYDTYSKCVEALNSGAIDAVTTDNVILAGFAAQEQYKNKLKVVGKEFSEERYGVGIKKGDVELCERISTAIFKMVDDGYWQKALEDGRPVGLQDGHHQPAQAGRLLLISERGVPRPARRPFRLSVAQGPTLIAGFRGSSGSRGRSRLGKPRRLPRRRSVHAVSLPETSARRRRSK